MDTVSAPVISAIRAEASLSTSSDASNVHESDELKNPKRDSGDWEGYSRLTDHEKKVLAKFLADNFDQLFAVVVSLAAIATSIWIAELNFDAQNAKGADPGGLRPALALARSLRKHPAIDRLLPIDYTVSIQLYFYYY